jgi:hypothetical protein
VPCTNTKCYVHVLLEIVEFELMHIASSVSTRHSNLAQSFFVGRYKFYELMGRWILQ